MRGPRRLLAAPALGALLALAGCGSETIRTGAFLPEGARTQAQQVGLFTPPSAFTATRADIAAAGITVPVIKVSLTRPRVESAGYILQGTTQSGVELFRDLGGSEIFLADGLLRATTGQKDELVGADTAPTRAALTALHGGQAAPEIIPESYARTLRHRRGEGVLFATRVFCTLRQEGPAEIEIVGLSFATTGYLERCAAAQPDAAGRRMAFDNRYWLTASGDVIASEQWLNRARGHLRIERVD